MFRPNGNKRSLAWLDGDNAGSPGQGGGSGSTPGTPTGKKQRIGTPQAAAAVKSDARTAVMLVREILVEGKGNPYRPDGIRADIFTRHKRVVEVDDDLIRRVLEAHDDIEMNPVNGLLSWKDPYDLGNQKNLEEYIKLHSQEPGGVPIKFIRDHWPSSSSSADKFQPILERLEASGKILIMRGPGSGLLQPGAVPKKHKTLTGYDKVADTMMDAGPRIWRSVFWDDVRERGDAPVKGLGPEFTQMWADIKTNSTADLEDLLSKLGHTVSALDQAKKTAVRAPTKRKKVTKQREAKRLTNTHLLSLGIDLSKDYVPEE